MSALSGRQAWAATNLVGASGSESMVLDRTENGRKTWAMLSSSITAKMATHPNEHPTSRHPIPLDGSGVVFALPHEGFISGGQTGTNAESAALWRTTDGGNNWFPVAISARPGELPNWALAPTFFGAQDGVMAVEVNTRELARTMVVKHGGKGLCCPFLPKWVGHFGHTPRRIRGCMWPSRPMPKAPSRRPNSMRPPTAGVPSVVWKTTDGGQQWFPVSPS